MRPIPAELCAGPFRRADAIRLGVTERMLLGRRFRRLLRDVYVLSDLPVAHALTCAAVPLAVPEGVLSHASAVLACGLPLGVAEPAPVRPHVTTVVGLSTADRAGLVNHVELLPAWQVTRTGLGRTTSVARTFVDRAAELRIEDLVALGDAALHRELVTKAELESVVGWGAGRRGVVGARRALRMLDGRAESPMESWVRVVLLVAGLPHPEVNAVIRDSSGGWLARADLLYRQARLVIEYDGRVHLTERQRRADLRRRNLLTSEGWTVLHVTADDVLRHPDRVVALVESFLYASAA